MQTKQQLIEKLFANQCSTKELALLFEMIRDDDAEAGPEVMMELFQQMGKVPDLDALISDRILDRVMSVTSEEELQPKAKVISLKKTKDKKWIGKVAAAILLLMAGSWFVFQFFSPTELTIQTTYGEIKEFSLPDGSLVTLNGNSTMSYAATWTETETRVVKLQGEAYFEVKKKPATQTKFQVITRDLIVEVLGTAFNVNTRQEATKVFLEEGVVKLNLVDQKASELYLAPGELVSYSTEKKLLLSPQKVENELQVSWKQGILTVKDAPLKEILEKLAATNNFEFEIEERGLAERKFTLSLPNDNMEEAMSLLSRTTNTSISKNESKFIIRLKPELDKKE